MRNKSFGKNLLVVAFSRMVSLVSGIAVGFILPKILSVTDYGFYKVFTLYAVYTALLHFGFVDGILLKLSGREYGELDQRKMRTYTRFFLSLETAISVALAVAGGCMARGEYRFVVIMLAANTVFVNVTTYYQFISQAVQRFGEYSAKNIVASVGKVIFVAVLLVMSACHVIDVSYRVYLIGLNILDLSMMLWYIVIYRDITFGKGAPLASVKKDIGEIFRTGIILTLAYQVSHLILALDRQFVNLLFPTETFAVYSFAYNIVSMISTMVSSVSVVLLPMLKNRESEAVIRSYKTCLSTVGLIASGGLLCYFPLKAFVEWFLPEYSGSIPYVAIVLPAFLFTSAVTVVMFTIHKVLDMNFAFFRDGCLILVLGAVFNAVAYGIFASPVAISYASLAVTVLWFLLTGLRLGRRTGARMYRDLAYLCAVATGFLVITNWVAHVLIGALLYLLWYALASLLFHRNVIGDCMRTLRNKFRHS